MKRTGYYFLVFLLGACLFSSAKQRMTECDKLKVSLPVIVKESVVSRHDESGEGYGLSPLNFFLADF